MGSFCNLAGVLIDLSDWDEHGDGILMAGGGAAGETLGLQGAQRAQGAVERALVMRGASHHLTKRLIMTHVNDLVNRMLGIILPVGYGCSAIAGSVLHRREYEDVLDLDRDPAMSRLT